MSRQSNFEFITFRVKHSRGKMHIGKKLIVFTINHLTIKCSSVYVNSHPAGTSDAVTLCFTPRHTDINTSLGLYIERDKVSVYIRTFVRP